VKRGLWRTIYGITTAVVLTGLGAVAYCVDTNRVLDAIGSLTLFIAGVIAFRMAWEIDVLHRRRMRLAAQERLLEAERGVFERDSERARRELADQERASREAFRVKRTELLRQVDRERDMMRTENDNNKSRWERAAFRKGFEMAENGIGVESHPAEVIYLPFGSQAETIMGTGTTRQ
jgi:hypothetical protein